MPDGEQQGLPAESAGLWQSTRRELPLPGAPATSGPPVPPAGPQAPMLPGPASRLPHGNRARVWAAERPYPKPLVEDPDGHAAVHAATRALLWVTSRADAARVLQTAVRDLGGAIVPARLEPQNALHVDVSLGATEPLLVVVEPDSAAALRLTVALPALLEDAAGAAARADRMALQQHQASVDLLTGVASRAEIGPRLSEAQIGDVLVLLDLDRFKMLNDTEGHAAGDQVLNAFGQSLRAHVRAGDFCARYGGDEFLLLLPQATQPQTARVVERLIGSWDEGGTTVSAGAAVMDERGPQVALRAADRALYQAKDAGRRRLVFADVGDVAPGTPSVLPAPRDVGEGT